MPWGTPIMAIAILGWPIDKLSEEVAQQVLEGARAVCAKAGIPLAGGHSIDSPEPIFGLAVTGVVSKEHLKKNNTARAGDLLYLTKPLGVGMITTAIKRGLARPEDFEEAIRVMSKLNQLGQELGKLKYVTALTDVTGFGLLGHLVEVCEGSNVSAEIDYSKVPLLSNISHYAAQMIYPDNTTRNWNSYQNKVTGIGSESFFTLSDPQTSGGLLICVRPEEQKTFEIFTNDLGYPLIPFGHLKEKSEFWITVNKSK